MAARPRVHEIASDLGVPSKDVMQVLRDMGEYLKGPSSSIEPSVARRIKAAMPAAVAVFPALGDERSIRIAAHITALPRQMPELVDLLTAGHESSQRVPALISEAAASRNFYFIPDRAFEPLRVAAEATRSMHRDDLLALTGVALISHRQTSGGLRLRVLAWVEREDRLDIATTTLITAANPRSRASATRALTSTLRRGPGGYEELGSVSMGRTLAALSTLIPLRTPSAGESKPRNEIPAEAVPSGATQVIYATRSALGLGATDGEGTGAPRSSRWKVSGHWRDQWYPSMQDRKRIWIAEHEAGAADGDLVQRERVYIVAPRK